MLDEPMDSTQAPAEAAAAAPTTRRRRSASRPSGPPAPVAPPAPTAETSPAGPDASPAATPAPDSAPIEAAPAKAPAKRSRAKKAVAVEPTEQQLSAEPAAEDATVVAAATVTVDHVPGSVTTSEPGTTRQPRRRASRAAAAPAPVAAPVVETPAAPAVDPLVEAIATLDATPPARRRRSARRDAGAPAPLPDLTAAIAAVIEGDATPALSASARRAELEAGAVADAEPDEDVAELDGEPIDLVAVAADLDDHDDDDDTDEQADDADGTDDDGVGPRRRRRRRGGRRRRRPGEVGSGVRTGSPVAPDDADHVDHAGDDDSAPSDDEGDLDTDSDGDADGEAEVSNGTQRRRRRRRRRGEDTAAAEDDPTEVVVRVREPRTRRRTPAAAPASDEVTGIEGSTRMEAKRIRRREGRAAGRRRAPILSEAEFLARRESVDRQMLIRQKADYSQIAVLEDGVLVEHYVDRASATSLIGNVYLGKVQNVLPSMEAAFVDIGRGRNAVLYAGEVDWDSFGADGQSRKVEKVFKSGQSVLVQVTKDPVGAKGARLTSHISIPGRYLVYAPGGNLSGISRKLPEQERARLKTILGDLVPDEASVIIRTAAEGASEDELIRDVNRLKAQWEAIEKKVKQGLAAQQLYGEPDLTVRIVRDLFTEDFTKLVIDGNGSGDDAYDTVNAYVTHVAPHLAERLSRWDRSSGDIFAASRIDEQIAKALERKVFLPSGGSLIIDRTEAMTVIDVNTGRFTGSGGNLEATVTSNNLEAAEEIVRQLRLRDIGGIIVIDFIDMVLPSNRELLLRRLVECLGRDRTRHQVAEVTSLGLVQMTRKKIGTGLAEAFTETCQGCGGRGYHRHDEPVESQTHSDGGERHHGNPRGRRS